MAKNILEIKNLTFSFHTYGGVEKFKSVLPYLCGRSKIRPGC